MSLLASPEVFPKALWAVWRSAVEHGVDNLEDVCQALCIDRGKNPPFDTVRECFLKLGNWGLLGLSVPRTDVDTFRGVVLGRLMESEFQGEMDFLNALAWWLGQDPFKSHDAGVVDQLQVNLPPGQRFIPNSTQWTNFERWAEFLGFVWRTPRGNSAPDPSLALQRVWGSENGVWGFEDWLQHNAQRLPVLQGGRYGSLVFGATNGQKVSTALSLALRVLESQGLLTLESRSDAPHLRLTLPDDQLAYSHLIWKSRSAP